MPARVAPRGPTVWAWAPQAAGRPKARGGQISRPFELKRRFN
jgi:hypothetical protein